MANLSTRRCAKAAALNSGTGKKPSLEGPTLATIALLATLFLVRGLQQTIPIPVPLVALTSGVLVIATAAWMNRNAVKLGTVGVEWAMIVYLAWNCVSMVLPHDYPAGFNEALQIGDIEQFSVSRFILIGTVIPIVCYAVGRYTVDTRRAVLALYWTVLGIAAYSAFASILQFTGPTSLVWPPDFINSPGWRDGRAVGVFDTPVPNGMTMVIGFAVGTVLASRPHEPRRHRIVALTISVACGYGIYLTHTRAVWLSAAIVLILGAILDKQLRKGYVILLSVLAAIIALNWATFTGTDRAAGGIASQSELFDRLNVNKTAIWATLERPIAGWGIGRFPSVNTYHHQQWSEEIPWVNGLGISAHETELGIVAELGLLGLVPWLCVLALLVRGMWKAYKTLPNDNLCGKPVAVIAILAFSVFLTTGLTADLRFFSLPSAIVFLLAGMAIGWSERYKAPHSQPGSLREFVGMRPRGRCNIGNSNR